MDDRLRSRVEIEAAAQLEWGHPLDEILANLVRLGATQLEAEELLHRLTAEQRERRASGDKRVAVGATLLLLIGTAAVAVNKGVIRYAWGPTATAAQRAPPQAGVGRLEFVLAYLLGNGGFFIGVCAILIGIVALGYSLTRIVSERHRTSG